VNALPAARPTARQGLKGGEEGEAEPGGDEEEGEREVPVRGFGAAQTGVDGDAEQEDPDQAEEGLRGGAEQGAG
jgi:hypothetical protein